MIFLLSLCVMALALTMLVVFAKLRQLTHLKRLDDLELRVRDLEPPPPHSEDGRSLYDAGVRR